MPAQPGNPAALDHDALDRAMALWAMETRGLFSRTRLSLFLSWLKLEDARTDCPLPTDGVQRVLDLAAAYLAATGARPETPSITDLMVWSYQRLTQTAPTAA